MENMKKNMERYVKLHHLCCTPETNRTFSINYASVLKSFRLKDKLLISHTFDGQLKYSPKTTLHSLSLQAADVSQKGVRLHFWEPPFLQLHSGDTS